MIQKNFYHQLRGFGEAGAFLQGRSRKRVTLQINVTVTLIPYRFPIMQEVTVITSTVLMMQDFAGTYINPAPSAAASANSMTVIIFCMKESVIFFSNRLPASAPATAASVAASNNPQLSRTSMPV